MPVFKYETFVISGTRTSRRLLDTPLPAAVVKARRIREIAPLTVGEIAADVPGVHMVERGPLFINPSIRGLSGRRIRILIDGTPIISEKTMGVTGYFLNLEEIRRIEIIRGPGSVLYGSGAIGGVINVLSRSPFDRVGLHGYYSLLGATNNSALTNAAQIRYVTKNTRLGQLALSISGRLRDAHEYRAGGGELVPVSDYRDRNLNYQLAWRYQKRHTLKLDGRHYFGRDLGRATWAEDLEKHRQVGFPVDDNHRLTLSYDGSRLSKVLRATHVAVFTQWTHRVNRISLYDNDYIWETTRTEKLGDFWNIGGVAYTTLGFGKAHRTTFGLDTYFKRADIDKSTIIYAAGVPLVTRVETEYENARRFTAGVYAQHEWTVSKRWLSLILGGRYDRVDTWARKDQELPEVTHTGLNEWSGTLGAVFHPTRDTALTVNVGRAFRAPQMKELFFIGTTCFGVYCGDPDLKPEASLSVDVGFKGRYRWLRFEAYFFNNLVDNLITPTLVPLEQQQGECEFVYTNTAKAWLIGGEASLSLRIPLMRRALLRLTPFVMGSYVQAKNRQTGEPLPDIPPLRVRGGVRLDGRRGPKVLGYQVQFTVEHQLAQDRIDPSAGETATGSFTVLGVSAGLTFGRFLCFESARLGIRVSNLTDHRFRQHLSRTEAVGRNAKLSLKLTY